MSDCFDPTYRLLMTTEAALSNCKMSVWNCRLDNNKVDCLASCREHLAEESHIFGSTDQKQVTDWQWQTGILVDIRKRKIMYVLLILTTIQLNNSTIN